MIFNLGASRSSSSSSSESQSSSFDNMDSSSFDFGMNRSSSGGSSRSRVAFEDIFRSLFSGASATAAGIDTAGIGDAAGMLFSSGTGFLDNLTDGGEGAGFLRDQLSNSDDLVNSQIDLLKSDIGEFLSETVNPAITSGGVSAGTLGGSRGEIQKGLATESALEEFTRGAVSIRGSERERLTGIASGLMDSNQAANSSALSFLPSLFGLAQGGAMSSLDPFLALSQILGPQTVLSDSDQFAESFGFNTGGSSATGRAGSQSTSNSESESSSMSFSGGFG